jgi:hypothetical protein
MSELMRFRLVRAPQKRIVPNETRIFLDSSPAEPYDEYDPHAFSERLENMLADPDSYMVGYQDDQVTIVGKPAALATQLDRLDNWLTLHGNRAALDDLCRIFFQTGENIEPERIGRENPFDDLQKNAEHLLHRAGINWWIDRRNVALSLIAAGLRNVEPSVAVYLNRLMLIFGLVELAAETPQQFKDSADVYWALRWRYVILPKSLTEHYNARRSYSILARRPGFADMYVVRDEWAAYEAGEIAHIENVMAGETRERKHTRETESEEIISGTEERGRLDEHDIQTTDRFDLHEESQRDTDLNVHLEGSVDTSGQYGPTKVSSHLGGSLDFSLNDSQAQATNTAHEIVARSVVRVEERVRRVRTTRSLSRILEENRHAFTNDTEGSMHICGIYRWVEKVKRVQVFRYPNRFLLEFQVPEPGTWLRWLFQLRRGPKTISENPRPLTVEITDNAGQKRVVDLEPAYIEPDNYTEIAARYKTLGLNPPPQDRVVSTALTRDTPDNPAADNRVIRYTMENRLTVPTGYKATTWTAEVQIWHNSNFGNQNANINVAVGSGQSQGLRSQPSAALTGQMNGQVGDISTGSIPVSVMTDGTYGLNANVSAKCVPLDETTNAWKLETYSLIAQAYYAMKRQYDEELAAQRAGGVQIEGQLTARNKEMAREDLKKAIVEMLSGADFTGRNAIQRGVDANDQPLPPEIDLIAAARTAPEIQFLEGAFEWENLTYVLYPYFWAEKSLWPDLADLSSSDPEFDRFLRAGSARVVVPARPGFEVQVWLYVNFGWLWGGGPAPAPDDDDYISVADEIRAKERPPRDGIPGESWEVRLPTTLVWLDIVNAGLPVENENVELDEPPGVVTR